MSEEFHKGDRVSFIAHRGKPNAHELHGEVVRIVTHGGHGPYAKILLDEFYHCEDSCWTAQLFHLLQRLEVSST